MSVVEMDREGFPLLATNSRLVADGEMCDRLLPTAGDLPRTRDRESGESTGRRVIVVRKPAAEGLLQPLRRRRHRMLRLRLNFLSNGHQIHQGLSLRLDRGLDSSPRGRLEARKPFRVPAAGAEGRRKGRGEVTISIWKEFCRGELAYDDTALEWEELRRKCRFWTPLHTMLGDVANFLPCCLLWFLRFLLTVMNICVPTVAIQIVYYHHLYVHMKIHQVGDERGLEPVFTGPVYQGPMIYSVRHFSCPHCRYKKQSKVLLRYFESLSREMRDMAVR